MLHKRIEEELFHFKQINKQYEDALMKYVLDGELEQVSASLGELKLGVEQGLELSEIVLILGKTAADTHDNRKTYVRYKDFFKRKVQAGYGDSVKSFINGVRQNANFKIPTELILYAQTIDDLKERAPIVNVSPELKELIDTKYIDIGGAYYMGLKTSSPDGDILYRCFSPTDKDNYETYNEYDAMRWVRDKNNHSKIITQNKQR